MRQLIINGTQADIDDGTVIGVTFQSYDVSNPAAKKVKITESFSIPKTAKNLNICGLENIFSSNNELPYENMLVSYIVNNNILLDGAKGRLESLSERIELFVYQKPDVFETLKTISFNDFLSDVFDYYVANNEIYHDTNRFTSGFGDFIRYLNLSEEGVKIHSYYSLGNFFNADGFKNPLDIKNPQLDILGEYNGTMVIQWEESVGNFYNGGHFYISVRELFIMIEKLYGVHFGADINTIPQPLYNGSIFTDVWFQTLHLRIPQIELKITYSGTSINELWLNFNPNLSQTNTFYPHTKVDVFDKITAFDFVNEVFKIFNVVLDDLYVNNLPTIGVRRFDDIQNLAEVVDFSGKMTNKITFKPSISGINQKNNIKYTKIYEGGNELLAGKSINSYNKNIDYEKDLVKINAFIPEAININSNDVLKFDTIEALKNLCFVTILSNDGLNVLTAENVWVTTSFLDGTITRRYDAEYFSTGIDAMIKCAIYGLNGEYNFLNNIIAYPKVFEIEKWLTFSDVKKLEYLKQYFLKELGGSFFINKISDFNPEKSLAPTKIELIKMSNETPINADLVAIYVDGFDNYFTDGLGGIFITNV